jgi:hypothetical protein
MNTSTRDSREPRGLTRRDLLKTGLAVGATLSAEPLLGRSALRAQPKRGGPPRARV